MGSKGGGSPKMRITQYFLSMHQGICHGPVDAIKAIWVGEKKAWEDGAQGNTTFGFTKNGLFGGQKKEGGVSGSVEVMMGEDSQVSPVTLANRLGDTPSNLPGFRGITSLFFYGNSSSGGFYWGTQPYLKPIWVTVERIPVRALAPATAAIPRGVGDLAVGVALTEDFADPVEGWETNDPGGWEIVDETLRNTVSQTSVPGSIYYKPVDISQLYGFAVDVKIDYRGTYLYGSDASRIAMRDDAGRYLQFHPSPGEGNQASRRPVLMVNSNVFAGQEIHSAPLTIGEWYRLEIVVSASSVDYTLSQGGSVLSSGTRTIGFTYGDVSDFRFVRDGDIDPSVARWDNLVVKGITTTGDANPAHVIYESLTDTDWGMGADTASIDTASFQAASPVLYNEGFGLWLTWMAQSSIEDFVNDVLEHIRGALFPHPRTGQMTLRLLRDDLDVPNLKEITPDNASMVSFSRKGWGETVNEVVVSWTNPDTEKEETVRLQDLANVAQQGGVVSSSKNYHGIRTAEMAIRAAERDLREESAPLAACEVECGREFWDTVPFDGIKMTWPEYGLNELVMRVMKVDYGDSQSSTIKLSLVEDVFSLPMASYVAPADGEWLNPGEEPLPVTEARLMPIPAYVASQNGVDLTSISYPSTAVAPLAINPTTDDSAVYDVMAETSTASGAVVFDEIGTTREFPERDTLTNDLLPAVTSSDVAFDGGTLFTQEGLLLIGDDGLPDDEMELALVTSVDATTGRPTLLRGVLDTVPQEWPAGTTVTVTTLQDWTPIPREYADGQSVTLKFLTGTSQGRLEEAEAPEFTGTAAARATLPTRPANLTAAGELFPAPDFYMEYPVAVAWSHRNRLLEDTAMLAWDDASIAVEAGTEYQVVVEALQDDGTVDGTLDTVTQSGTSYSLADLPVGPPYLLSTFLRVGVTAVRDGYESWQTASITVLAGQDLIADEYDGDAILDVDGNYIAAETRT